MCVCIAERNQGERAKGEKKLAWRERPQRCWKWYARQREMHIFHRTTETKMPQQATLQLEESSLRNAYSLPPKLSELHLRRH